jgi:hypothetical protein
MTFHIPLGRIQEIYTIMTELNPSRRPEIAFIFPSNTLATDATLVLHYDFILFLR